MNEEVGINRGHSSLLGLDPLIRLAPARTSSLWFKHLSVRLLEHGDHLLLCRLEGVGGAASVLHGIFSQSPKILP